MAARGRDRERIDVLLVERGLVDSRARAQARIMAGDVIVDDKRVDKAGEKVPRDASIRLRGDDMPWVSRGGLKLVGALDAFHVDPKSRTCVDVGASTGGFTDVLLARGAERVFAIDVGRAQLHEKLRTDARVVNMEQTHITKLAPSSLDPAPTLAVVDVSFISLRLVLPATVAQLAPEADVVALIKPQFEVGKGNVGKGGIVTDAALRDGAVQGVVTAAQTCGLALAHDVIPSPITGTDGNIEFLAHFARR
jgi:23S rRNA (cytidine1920-2'-O)/16S rRNA (cytidine1409-2'-O)-methyltransferase